MMALDARTAVEFALSGGQCHDAPQGRLLMDPASHVIAFKVDPGKYRVNYMPKTGTLAMQIEGLVDSARFSYDSRRILTSALRGAKFRLDFGRKTLKKSQNKRACALRKQNCICMNVKTMTARAWAKRATAKGFL